MSQIPRKRAAPNRGEEIEQARLVKWSHLPRVREVMPALRWLHHSPNGGERTAFAGAQMKALGVKPGFPDLILPFASYGHLGLVIEMKSATGATSPKQEEWLEHFEDQSWQMRIARSAQEARSHLCRYLGINPDSAPAMED